MSSSPAEPPRRHRSSLFARLLLAQLGLVLALGVMVGLLFYVERNVTVATLHAQLWAPQLAPLISNPPQHPVPTALAVLHRETPPPEARRTSTLAPRFVALRGALRSQGIPVGEIRVQPQGAAPLVWLQIDRAGNSGSSVIWLGVAGQVVAPEWSRRALLALLLTGTLIVGLSWVVARRLTRPLEQLRQRMQAQQPDALTPYPALPRDGSPPEIVAIDAAYAELLGRWQRHERERAMLLAGVSHDMRSPLGRIRMAAELLPEDGETARRRAVIVRNVAEADRLIESFLDFVRAGELAFDERVDLAAAARAVVAGFERPAEQLSLDAPAALPCPSAHQLLVERLFTNLIDNALKHGRPPVRVQLSTDQGQILISVEDQGDGLAPQQWETLQEAFRRGDSARSQAGSGLGLSIVRQIVARLGGRLAFERDARGQRVQITWAAGKDPQSPGPA